MTPLNVLMKNFVMTLIIQNIKKYASLCIVKNPNVNFTSWIMDNLHEPLPRNIFCLIILTIWLFY